MRMTTEQIFQNQPTMKFKRWMVDKVCDMHTFPFRKEEVAQFGEFPTLRQFLSTLRNEDSRHEFMAHYAVEWEIHKKRKQMEQQQHAHA